MKHTKHKKNDTTKHKNFKQSKTQQKITKQQEIKSKTNQKIHKHKIIVKVKQQKIKITKYEKANMHKFIFQRKEK